MSEAFIFAIILFFCFYSIIGYVFEMFVDRRVSVLFSVFPSILLYFLIMRSTFSYAAVAALVGAALRLVFALVPGRKEIITAGSFVLTAGAFYLHFFKNAQFAGKTAGMLMFVFLAVLILSAVQKLFYEKRKDAFPFYFFVIMAVLIAVIPKPEKPINWTKVMDAGERFVSTVDYYMPHFWGKGAYKTGYSNLNVTGGKVSLSDTTQIRLSTFDSPYVIYEGADGKTMKRRKTLYLSGGRGSEKEQIVAFVNMLYGQGVDEGTAKLFSEINTLNLEYDYLKTPDEIAPLNALLLTSGGRPVTGGKSKLVHKKGYRLTVDYLNIDYGSPYLVRLLCGGTMGSAGAADTQDDGSAISDNYAAIAGNTGVSSGYVPYEEANEYFRQLYRANLSDYVSEDEYNRICSGGFSKGTVNEYLDTTGASERMKYLAKELTQGAACDYDKCKMIEQYLRQYRYSTDVQSGEKSYDIATAEGAAGLAENFLFETGEGYCVHYASSMVMLLRLSGIPARMSVGYHYVFPFDKEEGYKVSGRCAHAWPEAYIENVGWVPFEPTSAYRTSEDNSWNRVPKEGTTSDNSAYIPSRAPAFTPADVTATEQEEEKESLWRELLKVGLPVFASVVALLFILVLGTAAIRKIVYNMASLEKKLTIDVDHIKKLIGKRAADDFEDRGLLSDYEERVPEELKPSAKDVFGAYYRMVYGGVNVTAVTEREVEEARKLRENIRKMR